MKNSRCENITKTTTLLWWKLNEKIGHKYGLCENGLGEVLLTSKPYSGDIVAKGNKNIQKFIKELLKEIR